MESAECWIQMVSLKQIKPYHSGCDVYFGFCCCLWGYQRKNAHKKFVWCSTG